MLIDTMKNKLFELYANTAKNNDDIDNFKIELERMNKKQVDICYKEAGF